MAARRTNRGITAAERVTDGNAIEQGIPALLAKVAAVATKTTADPACKVQQRIPRPELFSQGFSKTDSQDSAARSQSDREKRPYKLEKTDDSAL